LPEWLIEHGIGESRAVLIEDGDIIAFRTKLRLSYKSSPD